VVVVVVGVVVLVVVVVLIAFLTDEFRQLVGYLEGRAQLKPDGTRRPTVREVKGKHASGMGSQ